MVFSQELILNNIGKGPGEIQHLTSASMNANNEVAIGDQTQGKIVVMKNFPNLSQHDYDIKTSKLLPGRIKFISETKLIIFSIYRSLFMFHTLDLTTNQLEALQFEISENEDGSFNSLKYQANIINQDNALYIAGYSEPKIIKMDFDGNIIFHVKTIDNYDTSINYYQALEGEFRASLLSNYTLLSTWALDVDDSFIYVVPDHNKDEDARFINFYSAQTGEYVQSIKLDYYAQDITVKGNRLIDPAITKERRLEAVYYYDFSELKK